MKKILLGYKANSKPIYWEPDDRKAHCHIIGSSVLPQPEMEGAFVR